MAPSKNACSASPRVFGEKCSYAHRQVDERLKGPKRMMKKKAVAMLKKGDWHEKGPVTGQCHDRSEKPDKRSNKDEKHLNFDHLMHDN